MAEGSGAGRGRLYRLPGIAAGVTERTHTRLAWPDRVQHAPRTAEITVSPGIRLAPRTMSSPSALSRTSLPSPLLRQPAPSLSSVAPSTANWAWIAIVGCLLVFAAMALSGHSEARMARASVALQLTWLPTVERVTDLQVELSDLAHGAVPPEAWTPNQVRGRISDGIERLTTWTEAHQQNLDADTPALLDHLRQRWTAYLALANSDAPEHRVQGAERLHDALMAMEQLSAHCLAQSRAQADIAAGR